MDLFTVLASAFSEARVSKAVTAYVVYLVAALIGLGVVALSALPLLQRGLFSSPLQVALTAVLGILWLMCVILGDLAIRTSLVYSQNTTMSLQESWNQIKPRFLTFVGIAVVYGLAMGGLLVFFTLFTWLLPFAEMLWTTLHALTTFAVSSALEYALFFAVMKKEGVYFSLQKSIALLLQKPVDVFLTIFLAGLVRTAVLIATVLILLVVILTGVALFAALKTSPFGIIFLVLTTLIGLVILAFGLAFGEVWEIISLRLFFDALLVPIKAAELEKPVSLSHRAITSPASVNKKASRSAGLSKRPSKKAARGKKRIRK